MVYSKWMRIAVLSLCLGAADVALAQANLNIDTPAVSALRQSLREGHKQLRPLYVSGAIGLTRDGNIGLRDANAIPLAQRAQVNALIAQANRDRSALYREIARANGKPEWENEIRATFAQRWIERAPAGWYYQNPSGAWVQK
jgi:uncharacterized protein